RVLPQLQMELLIVYSLLMKMRKVDNGRIVVE
ncbi:hypothetical protein CCACVL1_00053, partial [Corchorus capsularis]